MTTWITYPTELPIVAQKDKIIKAIQENQVVIVAGDTGSGKTTQLPKMCLEAGQGVKKMIGCTQPRRIAATAMASRVAEELGHENGRMVGHKIRFQDKTDRNTRIKFMTDGILLAETQHDKKLFRYDTLIIDEAHERSLNIDFLLGYLKQLLKERSDLKIIISSATIDTEKFAAHFDQAPVVKVSGRAYPVETRYLPEQLDQDNEEESSYIDQTVQAVLELRRRDLPGDILIFMPTERDIRESVEILGKAITDPRNKSAWPGATAILPLFGRLAHADQQKIFRTGSGRKIVVATNVAETSITVPGIRYVIDTGQARISTYNARARTTSMPIAPVSQASCDQRQGRCGRIGPGVCVRLYTEAEYRNRPEFTQPEIRRSDLAEVILRMISLKLGNPENFPFIDPPAKRSLKDGYALLEELGAIDGPNRQLTDRGRLMARLPTDPRVARLLIAAREHNALQEVLVIAAALTIQDPRIRPAGQEKEADAAQDKFNEPLSDFLALLKIWQLFHHTYDKSKSRSTTRKFCKSNFLSYQRMREWQDIHQQLKEILKDLKGFSINRRPASYDDIHQAILSGFLRNIGLKKAKNIYQGARGHELMIFPGSSRFNKAGSWIMAAELVETSRLFARTVAEIKREWLEAAAGPLCRSSYSAPRWEKTHGQVVADEKVTLFGLVIEPGRKINYGKISPKTRIEAREIFIQSALVEGDLGGRHNFLQHNLKLVARLADMENRLRQRGFLADDRIIHQFYDQRLPDLCTRSELDFLLKKNNGDDFLKMTESDLVQKQPDQAELAEFPRTLTIGDITCRLSYKFMPGTPDDGVTAELPPDMDRHLTASLFEWLVPGLLPAKIEFLLKGLPKAIRKRLIPIKQTAGEIAASLTVYEGSLYKALEYAIYQRCRLKVTKDDWPELPDHLKMRFHTIDPFSGKTLCSRDLRKLAAPAPLFGRQPATGICIPEEIKKEWEREDVQAWDFGDLPEKIPLHDKNRQIYGYAYPGLTNEEKNGLGLRLFISREESLQANRQNLPLLYGNYFSEQFKGLKKEGQALFSGKTRDWALYEGIAGLDQIRREILDFILSEIFVCQSGEFPTRATFMTRVEAIKKDGLLASGRSITATILTALRARRETLNHLEKFSKMAGKSAEDRQRFKDYRKQLNRIIPPDFLKEFDLRRISYIERYCQGLKIRIERAHAASGKDTAKAAELTAYHKRLENFTPKDPSPECRQLVAEYRLMLEEFTVSLFAQELKTAFPVSGKRLDKKWREIKDCCY